MNTVKQKLPTYQFDVCLSLTTDSLLTHSMQPCAVSKDRASTASTVINVLVIVSTIHGCALQRNKR